MAVTPSSLLISTDTSSQIQSLQQQIAAIQVEQTRRTKLYGTAAPDARLPDLQRQLALLSDPSLNPSITPAPNAGPAFASAKTGTKVGADSLQLINSSLLIPGS